MTIEKGNPLPAGHYTIWLTESRPPALACFGAWRKMHADTVEVIASEETLGDESWEAKLLGIDRPSSMSIGFTVSAPTERWDLTDAACQGVGLPDRATPEQAADPGKATGAVPEGAVDSADNTSVLSDVFGGSDNSDSGGLFHIPGYVWVGLAIGGSLGVYSLVKNL